jgi:hypothetical protein
MTGGPSVFLCLELGLVGFLEDFIGFTRNALTCVSHEKSY